MTTIQHTTETMHQLARVFSILLRYEIGEENLNTVNERNATEPYQHGACATHDYCDSNQFMIDAFVAIFGREPAYADEPGNEQDTNITNAAWNEARKNKFYV
jgi:hypothetical protein